MSTTTKSDYMLLFRGNEWYNDLSAEDLEVAMGKFRAWFEGLGERGILKGGAPLGREGKIISGKGGRMVADGPFAESKEAIGGYSTLTAGSLDEAIAIAKTAPILDYGASIEVRPVAEECPMVARAQELRTGHQQLAAAGV